MLKITISYLTAAKFLEGSLEMQWEIFFFFSNIYIKVISSAVFVVLFMRTKYILFIYVQCVFVKPNVYTSLYMFIQPH